MLVFWIVLCVASIVVIVILAQKLSKEKQKTKLLIETKAKESEIEEKRLIELREKIRNLIVEIEKLKNQKQWVETQTIEVQTTFERNEEERQKVYSENEQKRNEAIAALDSRIAEQNAALEQVKTEYSKVVAAQQSIAAENTNAQERLNFLRQEIDSLQQQHSIAAKRQIDDKDCGRILIHSSEDLRFIYLLDKVKREYPEISKEIAEIEWRKIWQPAFKNMTADIKKVCGIYRIYTIDDKGFCRNYIGQGVDIRERWSEHIKKMVGSQPAGNELIYKYVTPEMAHFEIVEEVPQSKLDEREHYWIAYYNCTTDGYNTNK